MTVLAIGVIAASAHAVRADTVNDGRGTFGGVEIIGFTDASLAFRMPDGRIVSRPAGQVKYIQVFNSHDRMAEVLSEGEKLAAANDPLGAIQRYKQVEANARSTWLQDFAAFRQAQWQDKLGAFPQALDAYMTLTLRVPQIAALVVPKNLPAPNTPEAAEALDAIKRAERRSPPEDIAATLIRLRHQVQHGTKDPEPTTRPVAKKTEKPRTPTDRAEKQAKSAKPGPTTRPAKRQPKPVETAKKPPRTAEPTTQPAGGKLDGLAKLARQAIADGNLELAAKTVDRARGYAKGPDRAMWLLLTAELQLAQKRFDQAGLTAMRVVVEFPDSPQVGAALYSTGLAYEGLGRPAKAVELFTEAANTAKSDEATRAAASARLKALREADLAPTGTP